MSGFYNHDTRGASEASQILNLERMVQERDAEIERLRAELEQAHQVLDYANCPRKYVTQGGVTRCLYGTSSISAYDARNAEIERLQAELQLVTSPRDSVGEVVSALRSEIERLRMSERTWMEEAMRSHDSHRAAAGTHGGVGGAAAGRDF